MKILFAVHTYYPDQNGVQMVTQYLAEGLALKHDVTVIADKAGKGKIPPKEVHNKVKIVRLDIEKVCKKIIDKKKQYKELILKEKPDVFICVCAQSWQFDWLYDFLGKLECKKVLYTHGFSGLRPYAGLGHKGLSKLLRRIKHSAHWKLYFEEHKKQFKQFDLITHLAACSESLKYMEDNHIPNNVIIGNAVNDIFFENPVHEKKGRFNEVHALQYICVSNYGIMKNQEAILEAFYYSEDIEGKLVFIGSDENEYYNRLLALKEEYDKEYGSRQVLFLTRLSRQQVSDYLSESDVFISTSLMEACSVALLEAAAKGLAIISTNVGNASLIPGVITVNNCREVPYMMNELYRIPGVRRRAGELLRCYAENNARVAEKVMELEGHLQKLLIEKK